MLVDTQSNAGLGTTPRINDDVNARTPHWQSHPGNNSVLPSVEREKMAAPGSDGTSLAGRNCKLKQTLGSSAQNAIIAPLVLMRGATFREKMARK